MNLLTIRKDRLDHLRALCLALPEATEKVAWGDPTWRVRDRIFAMQKGNYEGGRPSVWLKAPDGAQSMLVDSAPERFFVPGYVGHKGWVGVYLDGKRVDWTMLATLIEESYRLTAPKRLVAQLGAGRQIHTTNYVDTFITIAPDSAATRGTVPKETAQPSVALRTFRMIHEHPYRHTSDEVIFNVYADRHGIPASERAAARKAFFSKPQACLRASDLAKNYGWGIHSDGEGRIALYGVETTRYQELSRGKHSSGEGTPVTVKHAMRSQR